MNHPPTNINIRKHYTSPQLSIYGRLLDLTRSDNGDGEDVDFLGSRPATRPPGSVGR